jgi:hypothetical protein
MKEEKDLGAAPQRSMEAGSIAPDAATARHTPGPWGARFSEMGGYDCMTHAWHIGPQAGLVPISVCVVDLSTYGQRLCNYDFKSEQAKADAHLIAAAPDLLAALIELLDWSQSEYQSNKQIDARAAAAIAKAEGRS